jgi:ATP-dependent DNA helicase DinG
LFFAANGGALGLFTAISRLKAVHRRIARPLAEKGLSLFAQHVDPMDTGTLVDLFRAERDACLLGTDAVRDGVDVPGDSLRLIVMDRVPWPTPTILERARKEAFGGQAYMDMTVRLRLRQAFGRLIRSNQDRGCFVILDPRLASRFTTAFPPGVTIERMGLVDAIEAVRGFCQTTPS